MSTKSEEIKNKLNEKINHCPFCDGQNFKISKYDIVMQDTGNRSYQLTPIICENCGNTFFIHGSTIGITNGDDNAI